MKDKVKIVTSLEKLQLLVKEINETIKIEAKEQKEGFLSMLLGTFAASLLGSAVTRKGVIRAGEGVLKV